MNSTNILPQRKQIRIPLKSDIIPTLLIFMVSRATVMGMSPFAAAFFGAVYDMRIAYMGIAASLMGMAFSAAGTESIPKYIITMAVLAAYRIIAKSAAKRSAVKDSAAVGLSVALGGGAMLFADFGGIFDLFFLFTESAAASLMYIIFSKAGEATSDISRRRGMDSEEYVCTAVTVGVILAGTAGIGWHGIEPSQILTSYVLLVTALNTSVSTAACSGMCIGFMASVSMRGTVVMMGIYGFCTMFAGFMNTYRRIGCFVGYICAMSVMAIYAKTAYDITFGVPNAVIGGILFLATPKTVHEYFRSFFTKSMQVEKVNPSRRMREYLSMRLIKTAEAFSSLHESFFSMTDGRLKKYSDGVGEILDETAERVCENCKMCGKCWQTDFRKTYKNMLELIAVIENDGMLKSDNIPPRFGAKCERAEKFINEINHVYELYKRDVLRRSDAAVTGSLISAQYSELNKLFLSMADDVEEGFEFMEDKEEKIVNELGKIGIIPYEISAIESAGGICEVYLRLAPSVLHSAVEGTLSDILGRNISYEGTENGLSKYVSGAMYEIEKASLQLARDGFGVNGDSIAMFKTDSGKFYCIIADGMGSGNEAKYESASACRLLTGFLKAGFGIKTALGVLNSSMCLNMENEIYSTVDLLCVDLYTAEAQLYKIGSAQTVLTNGGEVKTISSASVPAGMLSDIRLDRKTISLGEGDVILMMSDGITESGCSVSRTDWIKKIIVKPKDSMDELAKEVMDKALEKNNGAAKDDMSVAALRIMSI